MRKRSVNQTPVDLRQIRIEAEQQVQQQYQQSLIAEQQFEEYKHNNKIDEITENLGRK